MKITVMTADEQIITLDVDPDESIENVKASLEVETQVGLLQQQLLYNGKVMGNHEKLSDVGIRDGDLIMMMSGAASGNQKTCDVRMQLIRSERNKWSAIIKKVRENPHSEENELMEGTKWWQSLQVRTLLEILVKCKKFTMIMDGIKNKQVANIRISTEALVEEHEPANRNIESLSPYSPGNFDNTINVESPSLEARPPDRKAAKRVKRQASLEAHSGIGERVTKSLEEMCESSSVGWQRANDIHEDNQRFSRTRQEILILNDRIVIETLVAKAEKELYELDPSAMGSPSDKAKRVVEMKNTILALRAQGEELIKSISSSAATSASPTAINLESRFDEEASGGI